MYYNDNNNYQKPKKKKSSLLVKVLLLCLCFILFVFGTFLLIRQYVYMPGLLAFFGLSDPYIPPSVVVTPPPTPISSDTTDASPSPYVKIAPTRIYFLKRNMSAQIQPVGLSEENAIETVDDPYIVAWFENGASPGEQGNAIINGHVRWGGIAGTFSILPELEIGEDILIEFENGQQKRFYVTETQYHRFDEIPSYMLSQKGEDRMTLISCYGEWDSDAGTSSQRVFVICKTEKP